MAHPSEYVVTATFPTVVWMVLLFSRKEPKALALRGSYKWKHFRNIFREAEQTLLLLFWKRR
jgi:hypothetical protein